MDAEIDANALPSTPTLKRLSLPADNLIMKNTAFSSASIEELWIAGAHKTLGNMPFQSCGSMQRVHFGAVPPVPTNGNGFAQSSPSPVGCHAGDDPVWQTFVFNGNPTATLAKE